ncbi:MAG: accessory gene regulator B family protein [Armatimonadetes bacterium]|nr:accessory gene regulator B family protein [Armatimonadota bacterium]
MAAALVTAGFFRLLTGGAHCSSYGRCLVFGVAVYLLIGKMALAIAIFFTPAMLTTLVCFVTFAAAAGIIKFVPGEVPYRTINSPREVIVFKVLSLLFLILWNGLTMCFINQLNQSIILAAAFGLIVQTLSFTPWGYRMITRLDGLMSKLIGAGGEKNACA